MELKEEEALKPVLKSALLKYLSLHDVVLIYTENDDVFAKTSTGEIMTWDFHLGITMKVLDPSNSLRANYYIHKIL